MTFDALHANRHTMERTVVENGADFLIQVKANSPALADCLERAFGKNKHEIRTAASSDYGHGRIEYRRLQIVPISPTETHWPHTHVACRVERDRELLRRGETVEHSHEQSLYVGSFPITTHTPERVLRYIREHWGIENRLHHPKDRSMDEDRCRASESGIGRVMSCIRSLAALVAQRTSESLSTIQRRFSGRQHLLVQLLLSGGLTDWERKQRPYQMT